MGTYSKSNFGEISGKVGEGVGSKWRGTKYLRSLPTKSKKPASELQLATYAKFALSATQLSPIKEVLNIGFGDKKLMGITGYNAAVRNFIANSILGDYPNFTVDYENMKLSKGSLTPLMRLSIEFSTELLIGWSFKPNTLNSFADDNVLVLVFNQTTKVYTVDDSSTRADEGISIDIGADYGDVVHAWAFCINRDKKTVSSSQYAGTITMQ